MLTCCKMGRCNRVEFQFKRNKRNMKPKQVCVFSVLPVFDFYLQLRFAVSVSFDGCSFVKMTCRRVPAEPRRPVLLQNTCIHVNEGQWVCTACRRERTVNWNARWSVMDWGLAFFCTGVWSVSMIWGRVQTFIACWNMCDNGSQNSSMLETSGILGNILVVS